MREQPRHLQPQAIIAQLREHAAELFGGRGIDAAYLYGSIFSQGVGRGLGYSPAFLTS